MITNERRKAAGRRRPEQFFLEGGKKGIKGDTRYKRENEEGREIHDVSSHKVANI